MTIEEHSINGGLGSAVAETLAEFNEPRVVFKRLGIPSVYASRIGRQDYLRSIYSLTVDGILTSLESVLETVQIFPVRSKQAVANSF